MIVSKFLECFKNILVLFLTVTEENKKLEKEAENKRCVVFILICRQE